MSVMQKSQPFFVHSICRASIVLGLTFLSTFPLAAAPCSSPVSLEAGQSHRDKGRVAGDAACFLLTLDTSGIVTVDVTTAVSGGQARLSWSGSAEATLLFQSPTQLVVRAEAGRFELRVMAEDPHRALSPFRLATRFLALDTKSETDSEVEIDPRGLVAKSETDSEVEIDPRGLTGALLLENGEPSARRLAVLDALCRAQTADDHADDFVCASPLALGEPVSGELANGWGDDTDVFSFRLEAHDTVELRAVGEAGLLASLYDRHGLRLGTARDAGRGLRMARALVPGVYFVRIEGEGSYALSLDPAK